MAKNKHKKKGSALSVNEKTHSSPHLDYRLNTSLVNQLILEEPDIGEEEPDEINEENEDDTDLLDLTQLTPTNVIINFVEAWVDEDYELAYDLLADNSPLREGLSQEDWVNHREKWAEESQPDWLLPGFVREHESPASGLWLPNALKRHPSSTLEHGLIENPDSPRLLALLSSIYFETGEIEQAEELLQEAEELDPDYPAVQAMRHLLETQQQKQIEQ